MLDMTSFQSALKQYYTNDRVENMTYQDNPLLALIPKMESFGGKNLPIPIIYGNPLIDEFLSVFICVMNFA